MSRGSLNFSIADGKMPPSGWADLRREAISGFGKLGFPTLSDEEWRFTNLEALRRGSFSIAENGISDVSKKTVNSYGFPGLDCLPACLRKRSFCLFPLRYGGCWGRDCGQKSLSEAIREDGDLVRESLGEIRPIMKKTHLSPSNTSYFEDGVFVYVPDRTVFEKPVHVLHLSTDEERPLFIKPKKPHNSRAKPRMPRLSSITYRYPRAFIFQTWSRRLSAGKTRTLEHYRLEFESQKAFNFSTLRVNQQKNSNIASHSILYGGAIVRNNVHPCSGGRRMQLGYLRPLSYPRGASTWITSCGFEHASPHCDSPPVL